MKQIDSKEVERILDDLETERETVASAMKQEEDSLYQAVLRGEYKRLNYAIELVKQLV